MARVIAGVGMAKPFGHDGQRHLVAQHPTRVEVSKTVQRAPYAQALQEIVDVSGAPLLGTDKKRQGPTGRIVNISSTVAKVAIPLLGAYSSSKSCLEGMSDTLPRELMLFGIDVVIIEPGTVNTAMYDKGEKEDLSEFKQNEYREAVQNFHKFIVAEARNNGLSPERLGEAVHVALSTAQPKARYAVVRQRFKNWTLPRLLPARVLDTQLAKLLGLTKP
jgi:NAD(P)-dependent dehydrogenase (short-subunit alcohol dehydrogenase family)